ncbi:MAG: ribonuclease HI [Selenomonadaceae bacterium]|nr:ribonuclease HI [Selenomonadaceae bacterium]
MNYKIYTDGSCLGNPGAGGWAAVIVDENNHREEIFGGEANTTNNRMELTAAICALKKISADDNVELFTDSSYLKNAFTNGWLAKWKRNGWKTSNKKPVLNKDLWLELDELISSRRVNFHWVKGHAGHFFNERCDELARGYATRLKSSQKKFLSVEPPPKVESPQVNPLPRVENSVPVEVPPRVEKISESPKVIERRKIERQKISTPEDNLPRGQLSLF